MRGRGYTYVLLFIFSACAFPAPVDVQAIIAKSVAANQADFKAQAKYTYTETEKEDGKPARTYEVRMILGSPYRRLVAINGHPLAPGEQKREEQKLRRAIAGRKQENKKARSERIEGYRRQRRDENLMLRQMILAFHFTYRGEQKLGPHPVYVFDATPRPDYRPPNRRAKVLTGMKGRMWIDAQDYHWVKVEAEVVRPVYFEGFLARVDPGTRFSLEKAPVGNGIWLPTRFAMKVSAKIIGIFGHNSSEVDTYANYRLAAPAPVVATSGARSQE